MSKIENKDDVQTDNGESPESQNERDATIDSPGDLNFDLLPPCEKKDLHQLLKKHADFDVFREIRWARVGFFFATKPEMRTGIFNNRLTLDQRRILGLQATSLDANSLTALTKMAVIEKLLLLAVELRGSQVDFGQLVDRYHKGLVGINKIMVNMLQYEVDKKKLKQCEDSCASHANDLAKN